MAELNRIDFTTGQFTAAGKIYRIEGALTIERYAELQVLEKELGYGTSFEAMYKTFETMYQLLNKQKFADCVVHLNNLMRGIAKLQEREPTVLKICALFINTDDEDRSTFSNDIVARKIADWKAAGIDMRDFFSVASSSISGFLEIYRKVTQDIMGQLDAAVKPGN
jgi:hypothetical protein